MTIKIFEARKSWIWFDTYGAALDAAPDGGLASRMAHKGDYTALLEQARQGSGPLRLPWPTGTGLFNNFWRLYLEGTPGKVGAGSSWRHLMPLRRAAVPVDGEDGAAPATPPRVETSSLPCQRLTLEAFLYPHGLGLVATAYLLDELTLPEATERFRECFEKVALTLVDGNRRRGPFKLSLLATPLLEAFRAWAGGPAAAERRSGPFSIATIVNGEIGEGEERVTEDDPVHRALVGLCSGDRYWADIPAPPLHEHALETKRGPEQHLLLACDNGRTVWFPKAFAASSGRRSTLGCYHRNLTLLSLQVESLLGLVRMAQDDLLGASGRVRSGRLEDLARFAAQHLGRLYGRTDTTYRSASAPAQIEAGGRKAVVDDVRRRLGLGPPLQR